MHIAEQAGRWGNRPTREYQGLFIVDGKHAARDLALNKCSKTGADASSHRSISLPLASQVVGTPLGVCARLQATWCHPGDDDILIPEGLPKPLARGSVLAWPDFFVLSCFLSWGLRASLLLVVQTGAPCPFPARGVEARLLTHQRALFPGFCRQAWNTPSERVGGAQERGNRSSGTTWMRLCSSTLPTELETGGLGGERDVDLCGHTALSVYCSSERSYNVILFSSHRISKDTELLNQDLNPDLMDSSSHAGVRHIQVNTWIPFSKLCNAGKVSLCRALPNGSDTPSLTELAWMLKASDFWDMEATQVSVSRWMDKEDVVYIHNGVLLSHKKEWNFATCSNMDGLGRHYAKWSKSDRERQILYDITYMWNPKKYNKLVNITKMKQTHRYREQTSGYQSGGKAT